MAITFADERFPTDEERAERRVALHAAIDQLLDEGLVRSDGGWAAVERSHMDDLHEVIGELIDLKIERDADGDRTVQFALCNRRVHRMETLYQTTRYHNIDRDAITEGEMLDMLTEMQSDADYALAIARSMSETVKFAAQDFRRIREARKEFADKIDTLKDEVSMLPFEEASERILAAMVPLQLSAHGVLDAFKPVQAIIAERFPARLEADVLDIVARMAEYESDAEEGYAYKVRGPRTRMGKIWGNAFTKDTRVSGPANALYEAGKRIRAERRKA